MKNKISSKDFRVTPGEKVNLKRWPTRVKPFCESKKRYKKLLKEQVEALSSKNWKFSLVDVKERKQWKHYMQA